MCGNRGSAGSMSKELCCRRVELEELREVIHLPEQESVGANVHAV